MLLLNGLWRTRFHPLISVVFISRGDSDYSPRRFEAKLFRIEFSDLMFQICFVRKC